MASRRWPRIRTSPASRSTGSAARLSKPLRLASPAFVVCRRSSSRRSPPGQTAVPCSWESLRRRSSRCPNRSSVAARPPCRPSAMFRPPCTMLMARLDRVPEVKRVAQLAACIGREFDYRTLLSVADLPAAKLQSALERLSGAELVFRCGKPPDATYTFKHALVRDAAANSLLFSERRRVHAAILGALESADTPRAPELLAQHAEAAGLEETAIERWMSAGAAAAGRYANQEAVSHFERALRLVLGRAEGEARDRKELDMLLAL